MKDRLLVKPVSEPVSRSGIAYVFWLDRKSGAPSNFIVELRPFSGPDAARSYARHGGDVQLHLPWAPVVESKRTLNRIIAADHLVRRRDARNTPIFFRGRLGGDGALAPRARRRARKTPVTEEGRGSRTRLHTCGKRPNGI